MPTVTPKPLSYADAVRSHIPSENTPQNSTAPAPDEDTPQSRKPTAAVAGFIAGQLVEKVISSAPAAALLLLIKSAGREQPEQPTQSDTKTPIFTEPQTSEEVHQLASTLSMQSFYNLPQPNPPCVIDNADTSRAPTHNTPGEDEIKPTTHSVEKLTALPDPHQNPPTYAEITSGIRKKLYHTLAEHGATEIVKHIAGKTAGNVLQTTLTLSSLLKSDSHPGPTVTRPSVETTTKPADTIPQTPDDVNQLALGNPTYLHPPTISDSGSELSIGPAAAPVTSEATDIDHQSNVGGRRPFSFHHLLFNSTNPSHEQTRPVRGSRNRLPDWRERNSLNPRVGYNLTGGLTFDSLNKHSDKSEKKPQPAADPITPSPVPKATNYPRTFDKPATVQRTADGGVRCSASLGPGGTAFFSIIGGAISAGISYNLSSGEVTCTIL